MSNPTILAIHVGRPAELQVGKRSVLSAIHKQPVYGPVMVGKLNLAGDEQADLRVHGGPNKAVYCYPAEHYTTWAEELGRPLEFGFFGENLTVSGLLEDAVRIGDVLSAGGAVLQVTQPRMPCFKLGAKFGDQRFVARFLESGRSGFYCRVLEEGMIAPGQRLELTSTNRTQLTVSQSLAEAIRPPERSAEKAEV